MVRPDVIRETFAGFAMGLFGEAGHADASLPVFANHSPEQFVFFDSKENIALSKTQREMFKQIENVSYLFSLPYELFERRSRQIVSYYSAELKCATSSRSQFAHDAHVMFHPFAGAQVSVMLFKHDEEFILSIIGFGQDAILSDWYPIETGCDDFIERIHIVNTSIRSVREYYDSLIYCAAREYYIHPISKEMAMYSMLPIDYFTRIDYGYVDREEIQQMVRDALNLYLYQYGSDYVEQEQKDISEDQDLSVSSELDLILLDMDDDDEKDDNPFGEDLGDDYNDEIEYDEYEYEDLDPELFEDPTLLVKWLERRHAENEDEEQ